MELIIGRKSPVTKFSVGRDLVYTRVTDQGYTGLNTGHQGGLMAHGDFGVAL